MTELTDEERTIARQLADMRPASFDACVGQARELRADNAAYGLMRHVDGLDISIKKKRMFAEKLIVSLCDIGEKDLAERHASWFIPS